VSETKIIVGEWQIAYTSTFPARRYKYRHDRLQENGELLDGFVQVRVKFGRTEVITNYGNSCVMGRNHDWLRAQNILATKEEK
jgi:hypothetical protein